MQNQIVVYSVLTVLTFVSLLFNFKKLMMKEKRRKQLKRNTRNLQNSLESLH